MQIIPIKLPILAWVASSLITASMAIAEETSSQGKSLLTPKFESIVKSIKNEQDSEKIIHSMDSAIQAGGLSAEDTAFAHGMMASAYYWEALSKLRQFEEKGQSNQSQAEAAKADFVVGLRKSVEEYSIAIRISPSSPMAFMNHWNRGFDYEFLKDKQRALKDYDEVVRLNPGFMKGHLYRARVLSGLNRLDEAREELDQAFRLAPYDPEVLEAKKALQAGGKTPR